MSKPWPPLTPTGRKEPTCPLCAGKVLYAGLYALDCATFGCENGPKTDPLAGVMEELKREMEAYSWFPLPWTP